jgi:hypothetical protein
MSQEWLKQLAELSNDKELRKRAQQLEKKAARQPSVREAAGRRRSLIGAAFGHFFRWLFLFAIAEAAAMVVVASNEGLENEPWGVIFHYLVWYPLTQPIFPDEVYQALRDWLALTPADLAAFYDRINPFIEEQQDALVFYAPVAASLALTLFFLPAINAARRRSPIRFLVWLANWAVVFLFVPWQQGVIALWLVAFVFSFLAGRTRSAPRQPQPQQQPQPQPQAQPQAAAQQARSARKRQKVARPTTAATPLAMQIRRSVVERSARAATALNKREPAVVRQGTGSWIRGR